MNFVGFLIHAFWRWSRNTGINLVIFAVALMPQRVTFVFLMKVLFATLAN